MPQTSRLTTRQLNPGDAEAAAALVRKFHDRAISVAYMAQFLRNPGNVLLVAEVGGVVVGFLSAHVIDSLSRPAEAMFIYEVEVDAAYRRQGAGRALIAHLRQIAVDRKMFEMFVLTNHANAGATAFYAATGGQIEDGDELMFVYPL